MFPEDEVDENIGPYLPIIGPAILSMVFSNFVLEPVIQAAFKIDLDESFYETYSKCLSTLITRGLTGFIADLSLNKIVGS